MSAYHIKIVPILLYTVCDTISDTISVLITLGGRPTTSPLHYDDYENFLCQVSGEKEVSINVFKSNYDDLKRSVDSTIILHNNNSNCF